LTPGNICKVNNLNIAQPHKRAKYSLKFISEGLKIIFTEFTEDTSIGLQEDMGVIVANKQLDTGDCLPLPSACERSADISFVPAVTLAPAQCI